MGNTVISDKRQQLYLPGDKVKLRGIIKFVYKQSGKAILDYRMIEEGDKVLVAVSGGVDSLSMLKLLKMRQKRLPIKFQLMACFVDIDFIDVDRSALVKFFKDIDVPYVIKELSLDPDNTDCFWCSWNRRKALFRTAREFNCTKIALGHNLDDISETTLMNMCFFAELSTMKPRLSFFNGEFQTIRPLCYLEKDKINEFAGKFVFPDTDYDCPKGKDTRRRLIRKILAEIKQDCPAVKKNLFNSLKNIKEDYLV